MKNQVVFRVVQRGYDGDIELGTFDNLELATKAFNMVEHYADMELEEIVVDNDMSFVEEYLEQNE